MAAARSFSARARQAWTIARTELRRAFFAKRGLWVYALALLPALIFFGHGLDAKWRIERLSRRGLTDPALMNSVQKGEAIEDVKARLGKPADEYGGTRVRRVRKRGGDNGTTTHVIEPAVDARFVRLNISRPTYSDDDGRPDLRVRGLRGRRAAESRARPSRNGKRALQSRSRTGEGRERQRRGRESRQLVRRGPAVLPAGGSWRGASGEALRREARQRRRRKRGVRHPRLQHPGEHGRKDLHHRRDVVRRRLRRRTDRLSRRSSTSTAGARPGSRSSTARWTPGTRTAR